MLIVAYALSPIDLIPDFIPIFDLLDDLVIVPIGLAIVIRLTPLVILEAAKLKALELVDKPKSYIAASIFMLIWLVTLLLSTQWFYSAFLN